VRFSAARTQDDLKVADNEALGSFCSLIAQAPFGVYAVDADLRVVEASPSARRMWMGVIATPIGADLADLVRAVWPEPAASRIIASHRQALETGEAYESLNASAPRHDEAPDCRLTRIPMPDGRPGVVCYLEPRIAQPPLDEALRAAQREALTAAVNDAPLETSLGILVRAATEAVGQGARAGFYLANQDCTALNHVVGMPPEYAEAVSGFKVGPDSLACGLATATGRAILTADVKVDPLWQPWLWMPEKFDYRACWSFPIRSRRGSFYGTLAVYSRQPREATPRDQEIGALLTDTASIIISRHEESEVRRQAELLLTSKKEALELLAQGTPLHAVLEFLVGTVETQSAGRLTPSIALLDDGQTQFVDSIGSRLPEAYHQAIRGMAVASDTGSCCRAILSNSATIIRDVIEDPRWATFASLIAPLGYRAAWSTLIRSSDGRILGTFANYSREPQQPSQSERQFVEGISETAALVIERSRTDQALRDNQAQLQEADRRKDEFLAMLAHELRNPLAPIRTGLELIRVAGNNQSAVERVRVTMERQVGHMVRLIDDLLDVSRITSGKIHLQRRPTPLADLVNSAVDANRAALDAARVQLRVQVPDQPCLLDVDATRVVQVLSNLLHNAGKFTRPGGQVTLSARCTPPRADGSAGEVELTVADNGIGIAPHMLPRVFDLFMQGEQTNGQRTQPGLGIGLALARRLVEMHGGRIEASSPGPDLGSTFTVRLPLQHVPAAAVVPQSDRQVEQLARRVVIVDDNEDGARMLAMLIEELGCETSIAHDGHAGLRAIEQFQPDVVLLDVGMPGIDGYETCRRLRLEPFGAQVVVVALTGWGQEQDKKRAAEAGFDAHLTKPADPAMLERILNASPRRKRVDGSRVVRQ
jgi:signal transduction histidine kinase/ActR/RegA family two-component response regulator